MSDGLLITFNAGSSTIKIGLFEAAGTAARRVAKAVISLRRKPMSFAVTEGPTSFQVDLKHEASVDPRDVLAEALGWLARHFDMSRVAAVGHRIVHGGDAFDGPVRIDDSSLQAMDALAALAPLHQPQSLRLVRAILSLHPALPQSASFDTAFHRTNDDLVRRFAIPRALHDQGIKRYGFHGLS